MSAASDRARAIALLKEARDILAHRLTERVLSSGEELLEDAMGRTYSSEIDEVYEQLGLRLNHLNVMLSGLPVLEEPAEAAPITPQVLPPALELKPCTEAGIFQADTTAVVTADSIRASGAVNALPAPVTFEHFARQVTSDDLEAAGRSLAVLFAIDEERGRRCARTFHEQLARSPEVISKAMRLRHELQSGSFNSALLLLWECFGLQGLESLLVLQTLQARLIS